MKTRIRYTLISFFAIALVSGCTKFLDPGPPATDLVGTTVFSNDKLATAALFSIYSQMEADGLAYSIITTAGISSDECLNFNKSSDAVEMAANNLTPANGLSLNLWSLLYKYIYQANSVLEGLAKSSGVSADLAGQLKGEALFIRAFCHFYLSAYFGKVPYVTSTDAGSNAVIVQSESAEVFQQAIFDLQASKNLLSADYLNASNQKGLERVRPNRYAAAAILARLYLYLGDWSDAIREADSVINATAMYSLLPNLQDVFLKNSLESIWQLMAVRPGYNSYFGGMVQPTGIPTIISLQSSFHESFDSSDQRASSWIETITAGSNSYYYPFKFKIGQNAPTITEYSMVIRLAELYLIRAEARIRLQLLPDALDDINVIRNRAGLQPCTASGSQQLLMAIEQERRHELFGEFGDRWLDMKRTRSIDSVMSLNKGADWNENDALYPIPEIELSRNQKLQQNPGY